jgi:hypothetical protein
MNVLSVLSSKLLNIEVGGTHGYHFALNSSRVRWVGRVVRTGKVRNAYKILVGKPEAKRPLGRPRRRWEGNVEIDLRKIGCGGGD